MKQTRAAVAGAAEAQCSEGKETLGVERFPRELKDFYDENAVLR